MSSKKVASLSTLTLAALALTVSGVWAVVGVLSLDVSACRIPQSTVGWPYWLLFVGLGVAAFGLGAWAARWRDFSAERTEYDPPGDRALTADTLAVDRRHRRRAWVVQLFLVAGLGVTTVFLGYETWALYGSPPRSPITDFIRCASNAAPGPTLLASTAILFLVGHWLWHPTANRVGAVSR